MSEPMIGGMPPSPPAPPPVSGGRPGNPWDRRDELGFGTALIETVKQFVTAPGAAYAATRERGDFAGPLIFAILLGWVCAIIGQVWSAMFQGSILSMMPGELSDTFAPMMVGSTMGFVVTALLTPIYILVGLFIGSAILHVCIMVVGGLSASQAGFEGTFRVLAFAVVANLAQVVPFVGGLVAMVWSIVLLTLGLASLHRTTTGKALFAVLIPLVLCCLCVMFGVLMFGASMAAMFANG